MVVCKKCGYMWNTRTTMMLASCPSCGSKVKVEAMELREPDYEGFCQHVQEATLKGVSIDMAYLRELAERYNTPLLG